MMVNMSGNSSVLAMIQLRSRSIQGWKKLVRIQWGDIDESNKSFTLNNSTQWCVLTTGKVNMCEPIRLDQDRALSTRSISWKSYHWIFQQMSLRICRTTGRVVHRKGARTWFCLKTSTTWIAAEKTYLAPVSNNKPLMTISTPVW
jgi:hypothetical protein